ncbi:MAG TPA: lytic murein transglycosylase, partial [Alphaproteobacteria bacterium]|nr:lytic murein transglycosylase [Alphaproteobacteria bacterium]
MAAALALALAPASLLLAQTQPAVPGPAEAPEGAAAAAAPGADPAAVAQAEQEALSAIEASISLSAERVAALKQEIEALKGDRARQNAALIAAAQRVKLAEAEVARMEARLGELIVA